MNANTTELDSPDHVHYRLSYARTSVGVNGQDFHGRPMRSEQSGIRHGGCLEAIRVLEKSSAYEASNNHVSVKHKWSGQNAQYQIDG
jgi:hypothetical protein